MPSTVCPTLTNCDHIYHPDSKTFRAICNNICNNACNCDCSVFFVSFWAQHTIFSFALYEMKFCLQQILLMDVFFWFYKLRDPRSHHSRDRLKTGLVELKYSSAPVADPMVYPVSS